MVLEERFVYNTVTKTLVYYEQGILFCIYKNIRPTDDPWTWEAVPGSTIYQITHVSMDKSHGIQRILGPITFVGRPDIICLSL
jgi:hypothetical protein